MGKSTWIAWVPNLLSGLRAVLAIAFPLIADDWRLSIMVIGAATDFLDGFVARVFHAQSAMGKWLDPLADKMLLFSALITLAIAHEIAWWQAALVCARDVEIMGMTAIILVRHDAKRFSGTSSGVMGKVTTAFVFLWIFVLLMAWARPGEIYLFWLAATCSVVTAIDYVIRFARATRQSTPSESSGRNG